MRRTPAEHATKWRIIKPVAVILITFDKYIFIIQQPINIKLDTVCGSVLNTTLASNDGRFPYNIK